jgi:RNA polymerase sigma-70 factor (ECF subfamily)
MKKIKKLYIKIPLSVCNRVMEDKLLIWKFKRGSREALRRIYDKHHGHLLKLAVVLTGDLDAAEDVVQEVFVNFAQSAGRFGLAGSLKSYLITSTLNCVRNQRRSNQRRRSQSLDKTEHVPSMARRPDQWAVLSERLERLSCAMACLSYEQREVITLRMEAKLTFRQIARLQKTSISTVNGRYRYGIEKLRSLLNSEVTE